MTRNTEFTNWSAKGVPPVQPYTRCSPNQLLIQKELIARFGGFPNGCYGIRDNRAGTAISVHSYGAANDWSYRGGGRAAGLAAISWLVENSLELGVQAVHDYIGCRIWHGNRDPKIYPDGWKIQAKDAYGMGQTWADWLHIEVTDTAWPWIAPISDRLEGLNPPAVVRPVIGVGSHGPLVAAVQSFLVEKANQGEWVGAVDGQFGPRTRLAWLNFVIWTNTVHPGSMTADGSVDGVDWNVIAWNDGGWDRLYAAGFPRGI